MRTVGRRDLSEASDLQLQESESDFRAGDTPSSLEALIRLSGYLRFLVPCLDFRTTLQAAPRLRVMVNCEENYSLDIEAVLDPETHDSGGVQSRGRGTAPAPHVSKGFG